jgi:signal transduction histidine kinase
MEQYELLITTIGNIASTILMVSLGTIVLMRGPRKRVNQTFFLATFASGIFGIQQSFGINADTAEAAWHAFMWNINNVFIVLFTAHWALAGTGRLDRLKHQLLGLYVIGISFVIVVLLFPHQFLGEPTPFLYFKYYYTPGPLYLGNVIFFYGVFVYIMYHLFSAYKEGDELVRRRLKYYIVSLLYALPVGSLPYIPVYRIDFDPILGIFFGLFVIPITYGIIKDDVLDIKVVAKRALVYLLLVVVSSLAIAAINMSNIFILQSNPSFPIWIIPSISSLIGVTIGFMIWTRMQEIDKLKYEFVNVVTHKFRTPLTYIKWATEMLKTAKEPEEIKEAAEKIGIANGRLVELTDILISTAQEDETHYLYSKEKIDIQKLLAPIIVAAKPDMEQKQIQLLEHYDENLPLVAVDIKRMQSVLQVLIENAIMYSPAGKSITISLYKSGKRLILSVTDEGIGISKENLAHMFTKFFRTRDAKHADTEGLGIGLYMAKKIVARHNGTLEVTSPGEGRGATFSISLPLAR